MYYSELPTLLAKHYAYVSDAGHVILCIPRQLLPEAIESGQLDGYVVSLPVKYVLEKGYQEHDGYVVVDVPYDQFTGADVPDSYYEYQQNKGGSELLIQIITESKKVGDISHTVANVPLPDCTFLVPTATELNFLIFMWQPTHEEVQDMQEGNLEILATQNAVPFVLLRCGNSKWQDAPYCPRFPVVEMTVSNKVRIIAYDAKTGKIVCLRTASLPDNVYKILSKNRDYYTSNPFNKEEFSQHVEYMTTTFTTDQLVELAKEHEKLERLFD